MRTQNRKLWAWLLVIGTCALMLILAASLPRLRLTEQWRVLRLAEMPGLVAALQALGGWLLILGLVFFVAAWVLSLFGPKSGLPAMRRPNHWSLLAWIAALLLIAWLRPDVLSRLTLMTGLQNLGALPPAATDGTRALDPFAAGPPEWLVILLSLTATILLTFLGWRVWLWSRARFMPPPEPLPQRLAQTAQDALRALQGGGGLHNTILRCYQQMSDLVAERRGVQRQAFMTPREFVQWMEQAGIPREPVQRLTRLFELVRYGAKSLGAPEEAEAVACLTALAETLPDDPNAI